MNTIWRIVSWIGDRLTDMELAHNLGAKGIWLRPEEGAESELAAYATSLSPAYITDDWDKITEYLFAGERRAVVRRATKETDIYVDWNLDGTGKTSISTGLGFFDHMLDQIGKHSGTDLTVRVKGDLEVDEHHTIEDTAIALGEAMLKALGDKRGIERYGYCRWTIACVAWRWISVAVLGWFGTLSSTVRK